MYFSLSFITFSLLIFPTTLFALNTTRTSTIACQKHSQCPSAICYCNTQQHICMLKHSLNFACQDDHECLSGKCHDHLCRQPCRKDQECSHTKEYCAISNYCKARHCGTSIRNAHCANDQYNIFHCTSNCTTALNTLQKHT